MKIKFAFFLPLLCILLSTQNAKSQDTYSLLGQTQGCFGFNGFIKTTTHIYAIMNCPTLGNQLYVSNGTEPLHVVKQMAAGLQGSIPENILSVDNKLYFTISDDVYGKELWVTDGTEQGTRMIRDIAVGTRGSQPSNLTEMNGIIYFNAYSFEYGEELWRTDGTLNGTYPIADLYEGSNGGLNGNRDIHAHNNTLFFDAQSSNNSASVELYKTDGTEEGTVLVKDINTVSFPNSTATQPSFPKYFFSYGNIVLFSANDGVHGTELWKTDGTAAGTVMIKDINPGIADSKPMETSSYQNNSFLFNNEVYFSANDGVHGCELWKTDGTEAGTVMVKETNTTAITIYNPSNGDPHHMIAYNNKLYFWSNTPPYEYYGSQAWETDGTEAGTVQLTTTMPTSASYPFAVCNDLLYVLVRYNSGNILMKYDGTTIDTVSNQTNQDKYLTNTNFPVCFNDYLYINALSESIGAADDNIGTWKIGDPSITTATKNEAIENNASYIVSASHLEILTADTILEIKIINTAGREISVPRIDNHTLDISGLPNGMYIIKTNTDTKTLTKKIILTK